MLLSPKEVAERLGIAPRTAQTLMKDGEIVSCFIGTGEKLLRCPPEALDAYVARQFARYRRPLRGEALQRRREEASPGGTIIAA